MRQHLAKLAPAVLVGGCSLIYNPSNIDKPMIDARMIDMGEVAIDVEIRADAMPRDLSIMEAFPATIDEGSGTGGSRDAVVVLRGHNFVKDAAANLMVTLAPATAGAVVLDSYEVSGNGDYIALSLSVPVDIACADGTSVDVDVTVTQKDLMDQQVTQTLDNGFAVRCLDELDTAPTTATGLREIYSRIEIAGAVAFDPTMSSAAKATLRSASGINIGGTFTASAAGANPGPGGGAGGPAKMNGAGPKFGFGIGNVSSGGGGAGFVTVGTSGGTGLLGAAGGAPGGTTGDPWISKYSTNQSSGGGGGGPASIAGTIGVGGGGGGIVELTAPGNVTVGALEANGAAGGAATSDAGDGGAGTGGVVLVRAGNTLTLPSIAVTKGGMVGNGGASSDGRVRVDAAKGDYPTGPTKCVAPFAPTCNMTLGPIFVDLPTVTTNQMLGIALRGTPNDETALVRVFDKAGNPVSGPNSVSTYPLTFGTSGGTMVMPTLKAGYNKVCVWVAEGGPSLPESINCQEIAYLPL
jgi:hypothetical protein